MIRMKRRTRTPRPILFDATVNRDYTRNLAKSLARLKLGANMIMIVLPSMLTTRTPKRTPRRSRPRPGRHAPSQKCVTSANAIALTGTTHERTSVRMVLCKCGAPAVRKEESRRRDRTPGCDRAAVPRLPIPPRDLSKGRTRLSARHMISLQTDGPFAPSCCCRHAARFALQASGS